MNSIELFAGAGGMALGVAAAGFQHVSVVEWNRKACETIEANKKRGLEPVSTWPLHEGDARQIDYGAIGQRIDLVAGGPPCQPFSIGGKHGGWDDGRNMFPEAVRAVGELSPKAFVFENVRGLSRPSISSYLEYICTRLEFPTLPRLDHENWETHLKRLEKVKANGFHEGPRYNVVKRVLNAADFGVPQRRHRLFIVGFREDLDVHWSFPQPTHSLQALLHEQWVTGEYWDSRGIGEGQRPGPSEAVKRLLPGVRQLPLLPDRLPWNTVRDALIDLPDPELNESESRAFENHRYQPGARSYQGHTGSPLDEPSKTLKAGFHGVGGGENMLLRSDGSIRYFTIREMARLQTFPDDYVFPGTWTESTRQLGNAVPVDLARIVASSIAECL